MKKILLASLVIFAGSAFAQKKLPFQGKLLNNSTPVTGSANFVFSIPTVSWSETLNAVSVQDGYYSVVLGETTPLPDSLFLSSDEVSMDITVDGQGLTAVTLYAPFYDPTISTSALYLNDANDKATVVMNGTTGLFQSGDNDVTGTFFESAFQVSHSGAGNVFLNTYGLNTSGDGIGRMTDLYVFDQDFFGNTYSGGYRRSGLDLYDNENNRLANIGSHRDENQSDPTGSAGWLALNSIGTQPNVELGGKWWEDTTLGVLQIFGNQQDGGARSQVNVLVEASDNGGDNGGTINLMNTSGTTSTETIQIQSYAGTGGGGFITLRDAGGAGQIDIDGGNGVITASTTHPSDRRLKKNITPLQNSLEKIQSLQGVSYAWKSPDKKAENIGFIAQDVQKVYPELVTEGRNGYLSVDYSSLVSALTEAIKELNTKVEKLKKENKELQEEVAEISQLRKDMDKVLQMLDRSKLSSK